MKKRLTSLDAVRTFACIGVMTYHMYLSSLGNLCVSLFLVMSGFLSCYNHLDSMDTEHITLCRSVRLGYTKMLKLYPLFLLTLSIPVAFELYGVINGLAPLSVLLKKIALNVLLVQSWIPLIDYCFSLNGPAWYLSTILFSYIMLPTILRAVKKCRARWSAGFAMVAIWLGQAIIAALAAGVARALIKDENYLNTFSMWFTYVFPIFRLGDFAVGCLMAKLFIERHKNATSPLRATVTEIGAIILVMMAELGVEHLELDINSTTIFLPASAALVYSVAANEGYISKLLTCRFTAFVSRISSDIYLIHGVAIWACTPICTSLPVPFRMQQVAYVSSIIIITFIASCISDRVRTSLAANRKAKTAASA